MSLQLKGRSVLTLDELSSAEIQTLVDQARAFKAAKQKRIFTKTLANRNFCLVFLKPSTRTRAAFFVAASDEGGTMVTFDEKDLRFGVKESLKDIARVLGLMFDGIAFRGFDHAVVEELAAHAGVPVWNALSDEHHPTQALADLMTLAEEFGYLAGLKIAFVGDGRNNMGNSLMIAACKMGLDLRIVAPRSLLPDPEKVSHYLKADPHSQAKIMLTDNIGVGVRDCQAIYGDIWLSMGEEHLVGERIPMLHGYRIDDALLDATGRADCIFLHCLPSLHDDSTEFARAHPGVLDTSDALFEGPRSRVFRQAENRMHVIKALMAATV